MQLPGFDSSEDEWHRATSWPRRFCDYESPNNQTSHSSHSLSLTDGQQSKQYWWTVYLCYENAEATVTSIKEWFWFFSRKISTIPQNYSWSGVNRTDASRGLQGGTSWLAFVERKIIPQGFRRAHIFKFSRQKRRFLQLRKYWLFLAEIMLVML